MKDENTHRPEENTSRSDEPLLKNTPEPSDETGNSLKKAAQVTVILTGVMTAAVPTAGLLATTQSLLLIATVAVLALIGVLVLVGVTFF